MYALEVFQEILVNKRYFLIYSLNFIHSFAIYITQYESIIFYLRKNHNPFDTNPNFPRLSLIHHLS